MDDPQGKLRTSNAHSRSTSITITLIIGMCMGFMLSQDYYLGKYGHGNAGGLSAWAHRRSAQQQLNVNKELQRVLKRIAPQKEVMIAISDMNSIRGRTLLTWLKVCECRRAG